MILMSRRWQLGCMLLEHKGSLTAPSLLRSFRRGSLPSKGSRKALSGSRAGGPVEIQQGVANQETAVKHALERIKKKWSSASIIQLPQRTMVVADPDLLEAVQENGFVDVLAVSLHETPVLDDSKVHKSVLGNDKGLRMWEGNLSSVPTYQGLFDVSVLGEITRLGPDLNSALLPVSLLSNPGAYILISNTYTGETNGPSQVIGHEQQGRRFIEDAICNLPLRIDAFGGNGQSWISVLQVPNAYTFRKAPIFAREIVVSGFGRGSKQMGVPTANLKPEALFSGPLKELPLGVYFGWVQVDTEDRGIYKTVLNIGMRPSIEDGEQRTVELHILHQFEADFYGKDVKLVMTGFIRPEVKFTGSSALISRINADKGIAKAQLDLQVHENLRRHVFFTEGEMLGSIVSS